MTREDAEELIERIPFINTNALKITNDNLRLEMYKSIEKAGNPLDWIMVIKDEYLRSHDNKARKYPSKEEKEIAHNIKKKLHSELANALNINMNEVEEYINKKISEDW